MSRMQKGALTVDGNNLRVSMPFAKVDKERRLVSGWATADNIDTQKDIVLAAASKKAFSRARGNIREMHESKAVGKMVDFREEELYDPNEGKTYRGIFVTAYVSKGAPDTWEKVLDGTLSGFSIGGEIREAENEFNKDAGTSVRVIKDYDLTELSLVDNPANQLANVESIQKSVISFEKNSTGESIVKGMAIETRIENVFACENHDEPIFTVKEENSATCPECSEGMKDVGWFESGEDSEDRIKDIVNKFMAPSQKEATPTSEGGVDMGVEKKESEKPEEVETVVADETGEAEVVEETTETAEEVEEEATDSPEEVEDEEEKISKKIDELHEVVTTSLKESKEETLAKVSELEEKVDAAKQEFLTKASELENKINGFGEKVEAQKVRLSEIENSLEKMNRSDAFKKSAEIAPAEKIVQKETFWGGAFSG